MSQFICPSGLHTHQTCHPLSMFGMLWIDVYDAVHDNVHDNVVPFPANIQKLRTAIEEEWDNIPQAAINSLIRQMVVTPDTDWFSDTESCGKVVYKIAIGQPRSHHALRTLCASWGCRTNEGWWTQLAGCSVCKSQGHVRYCYPDMLCCGNLFTSIIRACTYFLIFFFFILLS